MLFFSHFQMCTRMRHRCARAWVTWKMGLGKMSSCDLTYFLCVDIYEQISASSVMFLFFNTFTTLTVNSNFHQKRIFARCSAFLIVMPQSYHGSVYLWSLNDRSSRIYIYVSWWKVRKRYSKGNLLFENTVPKCLPGKKAQKAKPWGHGEFSSFSFHPLLRHVDVSDVNMVYA